MFLLELAAENEGGRRVGRMGAGGVKLFEDCNENVLTGKWGYTVANTSTVILNSKQRLTVTMQVQSACFHACPIEISHKSTTGIDLDLGLIIVLSLCEVL